MSIYEMNRTEISAVELSPRYDALVHDSSSVYIFYKRYKLQPYKFIFKFRPAPRMGRSCSLEARNYESSINENSINDDTL